jgi:FkbM family methyltransferase
MKIVFQIDGGIGKSIAATAVCKAIKVQYPNDELIVITGYPEVFLCNPYVDKTFHFHNLNYFYKDHIQGQEVKMMLHNPYLETDFITINGHLIKVWCDMFGIKYNGEQPELFINNRELNFFGNQFASQKPILLLQTNGGAKEQPNKYSWTRDLPMAVAQKIVYAFANEYNVLHIRREDQLQLQGTTPIQADFRALFVLIALSAKRLFIDSFAQHSAAALGKSSVVCWVGNTPVQFGYEIHTNIVANPPTIKPELRNSVFSKYNISGQPTEFPYNNEGEIFNVDQIIDLLRNDTEEIIGESKKKSNYKLSKKIVGEHQKGSMVASRLAHLSGKVDLSGVKQILEIGSWHLGQSIEFSNVFRHANIDAFEPVPNSYQLCLNNLNNLDEQKRNRIRVHNVALSNTTGEMPFYEVDPEIKQKIDVGFSSMFKFNDGLKDSYYGDSLVQKEIKVQAETLDNWCKKNSLKEVDIMWIDVQGAELLVLQGAKKILKNTKIIMTEVGLKPYYEGHTLKPDIDKYLADLGFEELKDSFELNGFDFEANTIYIRPETQN